MKTLALSLALTASIAHPAQARADEARDTKGLIVNGAVMTAIGSVALILGGVAFGSAQSSWSSGCTGSCTDGNIQGAAMGVGLMGAGGAHVLIGIPLLADGLYRRHAARRK